MSNKYHCRKCHKQFETTALYPDGYRILCKKCEPIERPGIAIAPESVAADESRPKSVWEKPVSTGAVWVGFGAVLVSVLIFFQANWPIKPDFSSPPVGVRTEPASYKYETIASASGNRWENGSRVVISGGFVCKTLSELKEIESAAKDKDIETISQMMKSGRVKAISSKTSGRIVDNGFFQTQVEVDGFTGWIGTEMLTPE